MGGRRDNDWFTSTQRSADGNYSAEVDGFASDATLSSIAIDMSAYRTAELTFSWYIESGFDSGEYVKLDFWDGSSWNEIRSLDGNVDQEDTWHTETVELSEVYLRSDFSFRFRSKVSSSSEDANIDNAQLLATSLAGPPNQTPVAFNDAYSVDEDSVLTVSAPGILANDSDPDQGDTLTVNLSMVTGPIHGLLSLGSDGSFIYTPDSDYFGNDSFTCVVTDGLTNSDPGTVNITVIGINDAPVAVGDSGITSRDTPLLISADSLLSNDFDVDIDPLQIISFTQPASGTVVDDGDGSFIYTSNSGFVGVDSFVYTISDGNGGMDQATVTISVEDTTLPPTVVFSDSFENGQWNGLWVEDSQNDWFTSNQQATDGNYSAKVDGRATDATLTVSDSFDMSGFGSAHLEFSWYITNSLDNGEYSALDFFDGNNWIEVSRLNGVNGNGSLENSWFGESVSLDSQFLHGQFQFRYRANFNRADEFANVDHVRLIADSQALHGPINSKMTPGSRRLTIDGQPGSTVSNQIHYFANRDDALGEGLTGRGKQDQRAGRESVLAIQHNCDSIPLSNNGGIGDSHALQFQSLDRLFFGIDESNKDADSCQEIVDHLFDDIQIENWFPVS